MCLVISFLMVFSFLVIFIPFVFFSLFVFVFVFFFLFFFCFFFFCFFFVFFFLILMVLNHVIWFALYGLAGLGFSFLCFFLFYGNMYKHLAVTYWVKPLTFLLEFKWFQLILLNCSWSVVHGVHMVSICDMQAVFMMCVVSAIDPCHRYHIALSSA